MRLPREEAGVKLTAALPGERFGRLVVMSAPDGKTRTCRCDCGTETTVLPCNLTSGNTSSCGCLRREEERTRGITHGATAGGTWSRAYSVWHSMLQRCLNPNNPNWSRYGGRGITVCERWRSSFQAFLEDMGEPPSGMSLNRVDNDGPYAKENCEWATDEAQARNKRGNRQLTFGGRTQPLAAWAEELGIPYYTLHARLRRGWSEERTLTEAVHVVR